MMLEITKQLAKVRQIRFYSWMGTFGAAGGPKFGIGS
jgi:hypothetical protein